MRNDDNAVLSWDGELLLCPWCDETFVHVDGSMNLPAQGFEDQTITNFLWCETCGVKGMIHFTQHEGNTRVAFETVS